MRHLPPGRMTPQTIDRPSPKQAPDGEPSLWSPPLPSAPHRSWCTDCGVSRTQDPKRCGQACQFIAPDYPALEQKVHGRQRHGSDDHATLSDEQFFGPHQRLLQAWLTPARVGAQWSGITTRLAEILLERGEVDAVITMTADPGDRWRPRPVIVTRSSDLAACRGMRMGYAPLVALIEPALAQGHKRLAVVAIPCQTYALRSLQDTWEKEWGLEKLLVIGIPCSDNTTTERFHEFLALVDPTPEEVTYLEFRADYQVEIRKRSGQVRTIPFLQLPLSQLPGDFFPDTCRTCVDYTNALSDLTVGYMGGSGEQWLIVRNDRGQSLLSLLEPEIRVAPPRSAGQRQGAVRGFIQNLQRSAGGLPLRRMPQWLRPLVGWLMPRLGPRGLEFARARVQMKAAETVVHLRRDHAARIRYMVPGHVWTLLREYGMEASHRERRADATDGSGRGPQNVNLY